MTTVNMEVSFSLPFSLNIIGEFRIPLREIVYFVTLEDIEQESPKIPGLEFISRLSIVADDSNMLHFTKVSTRYTFETNEDINGHRFAFGISKTAVELGNALIDGLRFGLKEYHLDYFYSEAKIGPVTYTVRDIDRKILFAGANDGLQGGVTNYVPPRSGEAARQFSDALFKVGSITPSEQIFFDAQRFLLRANYRMALANLAISFETGLADRLTKIALARSDALLEADISRAAINDLGTGIAARALGYSFQRDSFWGVRMSDTFEWLRVARNGVLHKAQMVLSWKGATRDFNQVAQLRQLFADCEWFLAKVDSAVEQVLNGQPVTP